MTVEAAVVAHDPIRRILWARGLRDFGDGLVAVVLPAYLVALGYGAYSDETSHRFRSKPAACSEANQPGIPMMPAGVAVWFADGFIELGGRVVRQA